jgi:hypothetical protein
MTLPGEMGEPDQEIVVELGDPPVVRVNGEPLEAYVETSYEDDQGLHVKKLTVIFA